MREYSLEAKNIRNPIYPAPISMGGANPAGQYIDFSNYYMQVDGKPFFAICGEFHFSRIHEDFWEDEIIKTKMGGLNIISTYVFWIHHEEIEGVFDWHGNKNLRKFLQLCKKHNMFVILRIGPYDHGECRNGGFPDWIFGRPFDLRSNNEDYLAYTRKLFHEIGLQAKNLFYKDGGPIIATQLENEYEHASSPWEMTTENSKEWIPSGSEGVEHMAKLKEIAIDEGIITPFYTATAWGGSCAPTEVVFPLWGGYAFRPWMFYGDIKEHPATAEYIMNDFHNNASPQYYNFDPVYAKEDLPYACCEMGGGMTVFYQYRFQLPYESVSAMSLVKVASGCNFLGYYMYHGGTNPRGKTVPYLNENAVPKFSYDYQAALGEFGQIRDSYKMLKLQHLFYKAFQDRFCPTKTVLPPGGDKIAPEDIDTLRYAARIDEKGSGFLFINNYQDHVEMKEQTDFAISLELDTINLRVPGNGTMSIARNTCAMLPIHMELSGICVNYATTQLITHIDYRGGSYYFFHAINGMACEYSIERDSCAVLYLNGTEANTSIMSVQADKISTLHCVTADGANVYLCTLPWNDAINLWQFERGDSQQLLLSEDAVLYGQDNTVRLECWGSHNDVCVKAFPPLEHGMTINGKVYNKSEQESIFEVYHLPHSVPQQVPEWKDCSTINNPNAGTLKRPVVGSPVTSTKVINGRATIQLRESDFDNLKRLILNINYLGDIGYAFINGKMIHDNFYNGATWEIDLMPYKDEVLRHGIYIYISPLKKGVKLHNESEMAARFETAEEQIAEIYDITLIPVSDLPIQF